MMRSNKAYLVSFIRSIQCSVFDKLFEKYHRKNFSRLLAFCNCDGPVIIRFVDVSVL